MLKQKIKYLLFILIFINSLIAEEFYINEPILNSNIYVKTAGNSNNEAILFVHGLGDEASTIWDDSVKFLQDKYFVIVFDLPGFGKSSKENLEYTPEKYAQIINFFHKKYIKKDFYLVGHSMGAAISLKYASKFQENLKKLLIIDSAGILHKEAYKDFIIEAQINSIIDTNSSLNNTINKTVSKLSDSLSSIIPPSLGSVVREDSIRNVVLNSPTSIAALGLITEDWFDIKDITVDTYIIWGEKDIVTPLRVAYILKKLIVNSELKIIKEGTHNPIIDFKDEYFESLNRFLNEDINLDKEEKYIKIYNEHRVIRNQKGTLENCRYKRLEIIDSRNLYIKNCEIENLQIVNSNVFIIDSDFISKDTAIDVKNSELTMTSSKIDSNIGIVVDNSKIDLAAVEIIAKDFAIKNIGTSSMILTLTTINSILNKKIFQAKKLLKDGDKY